MSKYRLTKYELNVKLNWYLSLTLYHKKELQKYQEKVDILRDILSNEENLDMLTEEFTKLEEEKE